MDEVQRINETVFKDPVWVEGIDANSSDNTRRIIRFEIFLDLKIIPTTLLDIFVYLASRYVRHFYIKPLQG